MVTPPVMAAPIRAPPAWVGAGSPGRGLSRWAGAVSPWPAASPGRHGLPRRRARRRGTPTECRRGSSASVWARPQALCGARVAPGGAAMAAPTTRRGRGLPRPRRLGRAAAPAPAAWRGFGRPGCGRLVTRARSPGLASAHGESLPLAKQARPWHGGPAPTAPGRARWPRHAVLGSAGEAWRRGA